MKLEIAPAPAIDLARLVPAPRQPEAEPDEIRARLQEYYSRGETVEKYAVGIRKDAASYVSDGVRISGALLVWAAVDTPGGAAIDRYDINEDYRLFDDEELITLLGAVADQIDPINRRRLTYGHDNNPRNPNFRRPPSFHRSTRPLIVKPAWASEYPRLLDERANRPNRNSLFSLFQIAA